MGRLGYYCAVPAAALVLIGLARSRIPRGANEHGDIDGATAATPRTEVERDRRNLFLLASPSPSPLAVASPSPVPSPTPVPSPDPGITGDPHLLGAHGDTFAFRGRNSTVYSLLSARHLLLNAMFVAQTFVMGGLCKTCGHKTVHGSFIKVAYLRALTSSGKTVRAEYRADEPSHAWLKISEAGEELAFLASERNLLVSTMQPDAIEDTVDDVTVRLVRKHQREASLVFRNADFEVQVASRFLGRSEQNARRKRLDVSLIPLKDPNTAKVAPHGLIGQTFDGDDYAIDGALDDYSTDVVVTKAMGEGAIEGLAADYEISHLDPFSDDFRFSRFDSVAAPPRDTSKLSGVRRKVVGRERAVAGAEGDDVVVPSVA